MYYYYTWESDRSFSAFNVCYFQALRKKREGKR